MASLFNFEFYIKFVKKFLCFVRNALFVPNIYTLIITKMRKFFVYSRKKPSLPVFIVEKRFVSSIIAACCYSIEQNTSKTKTKVYHIRTCIVIPGPLVVKSASILGTCDDDVATRSDSFCKLK